MKKLKKTKILLSSSLLMFGGALAIGAVVATSSVDKDNHIQTALAYEGTPLPTSGTLSSGTYYLSSDLTVSSQLKITSGDVIVNLNGWTLNGGGRDKGIFHVTGGTLTVNGKDDVTGNSGTLNNGGGYYPGSGYSYGGALYITAGGATLNDLNITNCQSNWGGAIHMSNSAVTLNNCNLSNNIDTNGYGYYGAISVGNSSTAGTGLTVNGGEMFSNNAAIYLGDKAKVTINGTYIHDNDYYGVRVGTNDGEGGLTLSGNTIIKDNNPSSGNLRLNNNNVAKVGIVSELGNDAYIGVTISGDTKGVFTNSTDTSLNDASKFFSDDSNYSVMKNNDGQLMLTDNVASIKVGSDITYYGNLESALSDWVDGSTLTLLKDVVTSDTITVNNTRTLDFNGCGFKASNTGFSIFDVTSTGNLTVNDSNPSHAHKVTLSNYLATGVSDGTGEDNVNDGTGTAYINGGYVAGGFKGLNGGAFYVSGGTLTLNGGTLIGNKSDYDGCSGGAIYLESNGYFKMNGGSIKYNYSGNAGAGIAADHSTIEINGGVISFNRNNWSGGGAMSLNNSSSLKLYGGIIENNVSRHAEGAISFKATGQYFGIKGSPIVRNNSSIETGYAVNLLLNSGLVAQIVDPLTEEADIHLCCTGNNPRVITNGWSTHMEGKDPSDYFFSDNPNYSIYLKDGEAWLGAGYTVTFNTNGRGIAPDPVTVDDGSLVNKPTDPTVEGYEVKGWYKEAECENIWDFDNDTVTEDITLYALWDYDTATYNVINLINDIGTLTYDGGSNDSLADILAAKTAYDALTPGRKVIVDGVNKDVLDHDITTYRNVDKVGDLIKAIPDAKPSKDYYDAVDLAKTEYDKLTTEEVTILNTTINFEQFLNDDIAVKEVVIEIEEIGEVGDDPISQEKIQKARASYDSLSDEQKRLIAPEVLRALEEKESEYNALSSKGNAILVVLYIISGILLLVGIIYFFFLVRKKKNNDDNDNGSNNGSKGAVRLASFTGLTPFIIYTSRYLGVGYIILYVIIALTVIVWATDLAIIIYKKKHKKEKMVEEANQVEVTKPGEEVKPQFEKEHEPVNEDEEVITITDEKGNVFNIRYIKSFTAKLIQSPDETKKYYEELKNYVLSYKKTTSRISWHYDSINSGRNQVLKFAIRGKTLCLYYPLNVEDYNDTKYKVEAVESKKFEEVPCLYRIKNDRRLGYAKDLIDTVMNNLGLVKGEEKHEVYSNLPYEPNKPLIDRGLIKEQKVQVNKPVEQVVSKKVNDEGDEIITTRDNKGNIFEIRYIKSFTAKLSQASAEVKEYYNELKNYALSYKKANSRVSWHFDSINVGRNQVIKFSIRGKTLCVYYALNAEDYNDTKYKVEKVESKKFEEVPCLYRIKNDRRRNYAKDLIDTVMANVPTEKGKESSEDFRIPYESTKALLAKSLIKENKVQVNKPVAPVVIKVEEVDEKMSDEEATSQIKEDSGSIKHIGKKGIINIDVIAKSFANNEVVNIESLWEKKIISKNIGHVKVLARGSLDKKLHIELQDYSLQAVKMILLTGGTVKKVK